MSSGLEVYMYPYGNDRKGPVKEEYQEPGFKAFAKADYCAQGKVEKPVWRLAFFSRLEERKGLKVFVCAVRELLEAAAGKLDQRFEVIFTGADARIDMRSSSDWLKAKTASWK